VDLDERRQRVLGIGQLEGQLLLAREGPDGDEGGVGVLLDRLARPEELREDLELLLLLLELSVVGEDRLRPLQIPQRLLRDGVVIPEGRVAGSLLELGLLLLGAGDVKDSPGERARTRRAPAAARLSLRSSAFLLRRRAPLARTLRRVWAAETPGGGG
jgi:hypothetical protein